MIKSKKIEFVLERKVTGGLTFEHAIWIVGEKYAKIVGTRETFSVPKWVRKLAAI